MYIFLLCALCVFACVQAKPEPKEERRAFGMFVPDVGLWTESNEKGGWPGKAKRRLSVGLYDMLMRQIAKGNNKKKSDDDWQSMYFQF